MGGGGGGGGRGQRRGCFRMKSATVIICKYKILNSYYIIGYLAQKR